MGIAVSSFQDAVLNRLKSRSRVPQPGGAPASRLPGLRVEWPGGGMGPLDSPVRLRLRRRSQLAWLARGRLGALAQAYVDGEVQIDGGPAEIMTLASVLIDDPLRGQVGSPLRRLLDGLRSRWMHRRTRDERHVRFHYDLSDEFYGLWLDRMRVYSCAYFAQPGLSLDQAQEAKLELVCRKLRLRPDLRLLDIGAGWGGLLIWAAQHHGVRGVGITLSENQYLQARQRIEQAGLQGRVEVRLMDYRALDPQTESFDRIASVGMFEHVGRARLRDYFARLYRLLAPGGLLLNHGIAAGAPGVRELGAGMGAFIERNIFPGGELVHVSTAARALADGGLELLDVESLRPHYAQTLWAWSDALEASLGSARQIARESTLRAYRLYLAGSALGFERGWLSVYQMLAARPDPARHVPRTWSAACDHPFTRHHMSI
jgi:cyclopropane-fatty-acyl-phospholipid synthase